MKKGLVLGAVFCALCFGLGAQQYYTGDGGKSLGGVRVGEITAAGEKLAAGEEPMLAIIRSIVSGSFTNYTGVQVITAQGGGFIADNTLTGTITKYEGGAFILEIVIKDSAGISKASLQKPPSALAGMQIYKTAVEASEELISILGIKLTQAGRDALRKDKDAWLGFASAEGGSRAATQNNPYIPTGVDQAAIERARQTSTVRFDSYKAADTKFETQTFNTPTLQVAAYAAPDTNITAVKIGEGAGDRARREIAELDKQRAATADRQKAGNENLKKLQDAFLAQFKTQSDAVKKYQDDIMKERDKVIKSRDDILAKQAQIIKDLRAAEDYFDKYFTDHPPFEIIYDPASQQFGIADGIKRTMDAAFEISSIGTAAMEVIPPVLSNYETALAQSASALNAVNAEFDKIENLLKTAEQQGRSALQRLVQDYAAQIAAVEKAENNFVSEMNRLDRELIRGYAQLGVDYRLKPDSGYAERLTKTYAVTPLGYSAANDKRRGSAFSRSKWTRNETRTFDITAQLKNKNGKVIGTAQVTLKNEILAADYTHPKNAAPVGCVFRGIPVDDYIDPVTASIQTMNKINVTAANNTYIKVSPLQADGFTKEGWDIAGYDRDGYGTDGWTRGGFYRDGYDKEGYDTFGYSRNGYNRAGYNKDGVNKYGLTRAQVEKANTKAARKAQALNIWGGLQLGAFVGVGAQTQGGFGELGAVLGFTRWSLNASVAGFFDAGSNVTDKMVEEKLGQSKVNEIKNKTGNSDLDLDKNAGMVRLGVSIPFIFTPRLRLSAGGGLIYQATTIKVKNGNEPPNDEEKIYMSFTAPYAEGRLDVFLFATSIGYVLFVGYRIDFPSASEMAYPIRNAVFIGISAGLF